MEVLIISNFYENDKGISLSANSKILGFIGVEKQDIIIFLSRIACNLGYRVLIIDNAKEHVPPSQLCMMENRKVDFMQDTEISDITENYDLILINFGLYGSCKQDLRRCSDIFIVTDLQNQNIIYISEFFTKTFDISILSNIKKNIILKDVVKCKIKASYILRELKTLLTEYQKKYILYFDEIDYKNKILCQYDTIFKLQELSSPFRYMLIDIFVNLGFEEKSVKKAYKSVIRGD